MLFQVGTGATTYAKDRQQQAWRSGLHSLIAGLCDIQSALIFPKHFGFCQRTHVLRGETMRGAKEQSGVAGITWCSLLSPVCPAVEPVLSEPEPVATVLRELRLWRLLGQHAGGHKHTVAGAGAFGGPCRLLLLAPALALPSPPSRVVLGTELSQGCLSLAHFFQRGCFSLYTGQAFFSLDSNRQQ